MKKRPTPAARYIPLLLFVCAIHSGVLAQNQYTPPSSNPENLCVYGEYVYFSADDGIYGRELWRVKVSGELELVLDITPGPEGATIDNLYVFKDRLYFRVVDEKRPGELWRTDGTPQGTELIHAIGSSPGDLGLNVIVQGQSDRLIFTVGDPRGTCYLWSTDGSVESTRVLNSAENEDPLLLGKYTGCVVDGIHYVSARQDAGPGLWRTDGTSEGTWCVKPFDSLPGAMFPLDDKRFVFAADDGVNGQELWISGGTPETTSLLKDIYPGSESSSISDLSKLMSPSGRSSVVFAATSPDAGRELWVTDGTPEGTQLRADLIPGAGTSSPSSMYDVSGAQYLVAVGDGIGKELWRYNTENKIFEPPMDINSGISGSEPYELCGVGAALYFSAHHSEIGEELWIVRDFRSAPEVFADIYPGPQSSYPYYTIVAKGRLVTVATSPVYGRELWIADTENKELSLLADINTDDSVNPSSFPDHFTSMGDTLFFTANDIAHGTELWRTEGVREGTRMVKDIFPDIPGSTPENLIVLGSLLYFTADDGTHGVEIWRSDGSAEGTSIVKDIHPDGDARPRNLTVFKDRIYFSAFEPVQGEELWTLEAGGQPKLLKDIAGGELSSAPEKFFAWKDFLYFQADDGVHGRELWRTDGTEVGTVMVSDIVDAPFQSGALLSPTEHQGKIYFAADLDGLGTELWALDDTPPHFSLVRDIVNGNAYDVLQSPVVDRR